MKRFDILRNEDKDPEGKVTEMIRAYLSAHDIDSREILDGAEATDEAELLIVLGGDGTVLRTARKTAELDIPIIGFNLGSLGYLTAVGRDGILPALDQLLTGQYTVEERMMLYGTAVRNGETLTEGVALNDIVVLRRGPLRVMQFENYVNDELLSTFNADGIIVATPTGSTGYSLSAGGPIVSPKASLLLMTPIASHTLSTRGIIVSDKDVIRIKVGEDRIGLREAASVSFDGEDEMLLTTGDEITIRKADVVTKFVKLGNMSFLEILREKIQ